MKFLITWSEAHPFIAFCILLLSVAWAVFYVDQVRIDTSSKTFMRPNDPALSTYQETVDEFGTDLITVVFIRDDNLFTPTKLEHLTDLTFEFEEIDGVMRVESLATISDIRNEEGMLYTGPLMDWPPANQEEAHALKQSALANPIIHSNLLSADGNATAINIYLRSGDPDENFLMHMHDSVQERLDQHSEFFDEIFQIGPAYKFKTYKDTIDADFSQIFPLACLFIITSMMLIMRTWMAALIPILTSLISILLTFGFMGAMGIPVTLLTFIVPCLLLVVGSTEDMHMISEYSDGYRMSGARPTAIRHMANRTGTAILLTAITTVVGFFSISLNEMRLLQQFGYTAAFGLLVNFLATALLMPLFLKFLPFQSLKPQPHARFHAWIDPIAARIATFAQRYKWAIFLVSLLAFSVGAYAWMVVRVDNDTREYFRDGHPFLERVETLDENLSGANTFWIRIQGEPGDFQSAEILRQAEQLITAVEARNWVDKTISLNDFIKLINREINQGNPESDSIPDQKQSIQEFCLFLNRDDISRYVNNDYSAIAILVRHSNYSSKGLKAGIESLRQDAQELIAGDRSVAFTGEDILINNAADTIASGQVKGLLIISITVLIVMMALFMSVKTGVYCMLPNLIPAALAFCIMIILDIPLNTGTCMVAAISVGIAVDDTIHIMSRFQESMREFQDEAKALRATLDSEMLPILTTSVSLALGFGLLSLSEFMPIAQFGFLSACVMIAALTTDLLVTPSVLMLTQAVNIWDVFEVHVRKEVLERSPLLRGFSRWQMKKLIFIARMSETRTGDYVVQKGEMGHTMYMLLDGSAAVVLPGGQGQDEIRLTTLGPGDVFGEIAVINESERTASVKAETPLRYIEFDRDGLERIRKYYPFIASKLMFNLARILGNRLSQANQTISSRE